MQVRQAFVAKYRPKFFRDIVGQEDSTIFFKKASLKGNHPNGWLLAGPFGLGKTTLCRVYAKSVLCESLSGEGEPCNKCSNCLSVDTDTNPNYTEIDAGTHSGVKEIQEVIDKSRNLPVNGSRFKIVAIDECHAISRQALIKLLKPIEEGMPHLITVFLTTDPDKVNEAFRSRLFKVDIKVPSLESVKQVLIDICEKEGHEYKDSDLDSIVKQSRGHLRDAINFLEKHLVLGGADLLIEDDTIIKVSDMILKIPSDIEGAIKIYNILSTSSSAKKIWEMMLEVLNNSIKMNYIVPSFFTDREVEKYREILDMLGEDSIHGIYNFLLRQSSSIVSYGPLEQLLFMLHAYSKNRVVYSVEDHVEENKNGFSDSHYKKSYNRKPQAKNEEAVPLEEFERGLQDA